MAVDDLPFAEQVQVKIGLCRRARQVVRSILVESSRFDVLQAAAIRLPLTLHGYPLKRTRQPTPACGYRLITGYDRTMLLTRIHWPSTPDKTAASAARRALHSHAPATLHGTGMQLLEDTDLETVQDEMSQWPDAQVITLPAPDIEEYAELYEQTFAAYRDRLADELDVIAGKLAGKGRLTSRLMNLAFSELDILSSITQNDDRVQGYRKYMEKLQTMDHAADREKSGKYFRGVAKKVRAGE